MVNSIAKAFRLLEHILNNGNSGTLVALAKAVNQKVPTVHNLLKTLVQLGYLERTGDEYHVTPKHFSMCMPYFTGNTLVTAAEPVLKALNAALNENLLFGVERNFKRITLREFSSSHVITVNPWIDDFPTLYNLSMGRVFLAYFSEQRLNEYVRSAGLPGRHWDGIDSKQELLKRLEQIRTRQWAACDFGNNRVRSFSAPIFDASGSCVASVGIYLPVERLNDKREKEIISKLLTATQEISCKLGYLSQVKAA